MKRSILTAVAVVVLAAWTIQGQSTASTQDTWVIRSSDVKVCDIRFTDGKRNATLSFCGEEMVYSGDLPVGESARQLFAAYHLEVHPEQKGEHRWASDLRGWGQTDATLSVNDGKNRYTLDWCLTHGDTRVLKEGR